MPRRYVKRLRYNKDKYSIEQTNFQSTTVGNWSVVSAPDEFTVDSFQYNTIITAPTDTQGMRKVKHLTLSIANVGTTDSNLLMYAIVYVPAGYDVQPIRFPAAGLSTNNYTANQFVMMSGLIDFSAGPNRIRCPLARNLNSGDSIYLVLAVPQTTTGSLQVIGQISYAITLQ